MVYVGIDVAKDKHDCFITNSDGEVLFRAFTIPNNRNGFDELYQKIISVSGDKSYSDISYHNEELKSLTRYRFCKGQERAKLKSSITRLVDILFLEIEKLVPSLHLVSHS